MNIYQNPNISQYNSFSQIQQMFPNPQGSVYSISAPSDIGTVPIGSTGLSVALCLQEEIMYIKSFQNGNPVIMAFRISPYTKEQEIIKSDPPAGAAATKIDDVLKRLEILEKQINSNEGGKFNGLL